MKLRWLLLSILGVLIFGSPADAGQLLSWDYQKNRNRLVLTTDEGIQPTAKFVGNPSRLVIELPGTSLGRTTVKENYSGAIRGFRIGQSTNNTVSVVIEFAPGYTIDPQQVKFSSVSGKEWTVDLPSPRIGNNYPTARQPRQPIEKPVRDLGETVTSRPSTNNFSESNNTSSRVSSSPYVKTTSHGFFLDLKGDRSNNITPTRRGNTIEFDLEGVTLPSDLVSQSVAVNQYEVEEISFAQPDPNIAKITLKVTPNSRDWRATFSRIRGLIIVPGGRSTRIATRPKPELTKKPIASKKPELIPEPNPRDLAVTKQTNTTTVRAIDLTDDNSQLSIRSDRNFSATSTLVGNGKYEIVIDNAKLGEPFAGPQFRAGSPITRLEVKEAGSAVILNVTTKLGIRLGNVQNGSNLVALPIVAPPSSITASSPRNFKPAQNRPLVIIDPGHGGQDPGTVGIGGVQEKNVVLPISLDVVEELRKQGIEVRMTRDRDYFISLEGRTDLANKVDADLFVSIHANAINLSRPDVNGLETYYYKSGRRLAEVIHWNILNTVNIKDRKIRRARFFVLRHSTMPAVLVEVGFLTGVEDASRLKNPDHRRQMAKAIARGIVQYIKENRI